MRNVFNNEEGVIIFRKKKVSLDLDRKSGKTGDVELSY